MKKFIGIVTWELPWSLLGVEEWKNVERRKKKKCQLKGGTNAANVKWRRGNIKEEKGNEGEGKRKRKE